MKTFWKVFGFVGFLLALPGYILVYPGEAMMNVSISKMRSRQKNRGWL